MSARAWAAVAAVVVAAVLAFVVMQVRANNDADLERRCRQEDMELALGARSTLSRACR